MRRTACSFCLPPRKLLSGLFELPDKFVNISRLKARSVLRLDAFADIHSLLHPAEFGIYEGKFAEIIRSGEHIVGSIRSLRPYYLSVALSYDAIVIHAGGSEQAYSDVKTYNADHLDGVRDEYCRLVRPKSKSRRILREGAPAVKDYLGFLSGGCSKSPIDLLKGAGVDMTSPEPVNQALALFGELLDEMEELTRE